MFKMLNTSLLPRIASNSLRIHPIHMAQMSSLYSKNKAADHFVPYRSFKRTLYTPESLNINLFEEERVQAQQLYPTGPERFLTRIQEFLANDTNMSVYIQDLRSMIMVAENDEHLDMLDKLIETFQKSPAMSSFRDGASKYGSVVMRLYYILEKEDRALNNVLDTERFGSFFQHPVVYKILSTMLYNAERYEDLLKLYEVALPTDFIPESNKYETSLTTVTLAGLARIGTPDAFAKARQIYDARRRPFNIRQLVLLSYLAMTNDDHTFILNLMSVHPNVQACELSSMTALGLIKLKEYDRLRVFLTSSRAPKDASTRILLNTDVLQEVKEDVQNIDDDGLKEELVDILDSMEKAGEIGDKELKDRIFNPISRRPRMGESTGGQRDQAFRREDHGFEHRDQREYNSYDARRGFTMSQQGYNRRPRRQSIGSREQSHADRYDRHDPYGSDERSYEERYNRRDPYGNRAPRTPSRFDKYKQFSE